MDINQKIINTLFVLLSLSCVFNIFISIQYSYHTFQKNSTHKINIPNTISNEAQEAIKNINQNIKEMYAPEPNDIKEWKKIQNMVESGSEKVNEFYIDKFKPQLEYLDISGVSVIEVSVGNATSNEDIIVYIHGGAFTLGSAKSNLYAAILLSNYTKRKVYTIDYTLAPEAHWEIVLNQTTNVIKDLSLKNKKIAISGHSAGGSIACGSILKLQNEQFKLPYALLLLSPWSDISSDGDTYTVLKYEDPILDYNKFLKNSALAYSKNSDLKNPLISPIYGKYDNSFPPTLIQGGGTKEIFLSDFIRHYQVLDNANVFVKLDLYEGMFHVFPVLYPDLPESVMAFEKMNTFLDSF